MSALRERARKAASEVRFGNEASRPYAFEQGAMWGYRAALEDAAKLVCWKCAGGEELQPGMLAHYDGIECRASDIHAALAAEADKDKDKGKGEERA